MAGLCLQKWYPGGTPLGTTYIKWKSSDALCHDAFSFSGMLALGSWLKGLIVDYIVLDTCLISFIYGQKKKIIMPGWWLPTLIATTLRLSMQHRLCCWASPCYTQVVECVPGSASSPEDVPNETNASGPTSKVTCTHYVINVWQSRSGDNYNKSLSWASFWPVAKHGQSRISTSLS